MQYPYHATHKTKVNMQHKKLRVQKTYKTISPFYERETLRNPRSMQSRSIQLCHNFKQELQAHKASRWSIMLHVNFKSHAKQNIQGSMLTGFP